MATYNITVLSSSSSGNGYRFSGTDESGSISSSTSNPTINITTGDTINFTFSNMSNHPFRIAGTTITGNSANGGYYGNNSTYASYTFSSAMTYAYNCTVHGNSMAGSVIASAASTTTTTSTTTSTTATPTNTTTTSTTATPSNTTTTSTTATPTNNTTTTQAPTPTTTTTLPPDSSGWTITSNRSPLAEEPSTFFTFTPNELTDKTITDVEILIKKVNQGVVETELYIPAQKAKFKDLPYIDFVADTLPATCSTSVNCEFNKVRNTGVEVGGDAGTMTLSAATSYLVTEVSWAATLRHRVVRLLSVPGVNEEGDKLIDIPTSKNASHSVFMGHRHCDGQSYESNNPTSNGFLDIPPDEFEGGIQNSTQSSATMTKKDIYSDSDGPATTLKLTGTGDKEVNVVVVIKTAYGFTMSWTVPETPKFTMEYSNNSIIDRIDYDLYGYSFEVKDPIKLGWRQFAEYTADTPPPSGCDGHLNSKFKPFITQGGDGDIGKDQTVIRGHSGRVYSPGESLMGVFEKGRITDWVEVDRSQEPHIITNVGHSPASSSDSYPRVNERNEIEFERSADYTFRVRAIYKASTVLGNGELYESFVYAESSSTSTDYWVKQPYDRLGGAFRVKNIDFSSTPLTLDGTIFDAFDEDGAPDPPEIPE